MIKAIGNHKLLDNPVYTFTVSKEQLNIEQKEILSKIKVFNYRFDKNNYGFEQNLFVKLLLKKLIDSYDLYFYFLEKTSESKSNLRTHKKLMYPHRNDIGYENLYEEEVMLNLGESIIYSILYLTAENIDYIQNNLIDSRFLFGYIKPKKYQEKNQFEGLGLTDIIQVNPKSTNKIFDLNILNAMSSMIDMSSSMLRISRDGLDNDFLSLFYVNENHLMSLKNMNNQFKIKEV